MSRLIKFELKKIFSKPLSCFFLIAVYMISLLFTFSTYQNLFDDSWSYSLTPDFCKASGQRIAGRKMRRR